MMECGDCQKAGYLGGGGACQEEDYQEREEDAPRVHGMGDSCSGGDDDADGCQRVARPGAIDQGGDRWDGYDGFHACWC